MLKRSIKYFIIILVIATLTISSTYAYLLLQVSSNQISGDGGCFQVSYSGTTINVLDMASSDTYTDGAHSTITLSKDSSCKIYTEAAIYLHVNDASTLPISSSMSASNAFKYNVLNNGNVVSSGVVRKSGSSNDILLGTYTLTDTVKSYDIYLWIDYNLSDGYYDQKVFSGYLYANSVQTSTITN